MFSPGWLRSLGILAEGACQAITAKEVCYNNTYVSTRAEIEWQYAGSWPTVKLL